MPRHRLPAAVFVALLLLAAPHISLAADIQQNVPHDALGFVVIRNVGATNAKAEQVLKSLQLQFPGPLTFLKLATGIEQGLDPHGDVLIAVMPGSHTTDKPQLAIWLPVADYAQLVTALNGNPTERITAVTVAGEDVLVAQHGQWALVMDPNERERLLKTLAASPAPPARLSEWSEWSDKNDVTAAVLPSGINAFWLWVRTTDQPQEIAAEETNHDILNQPAEGDDDLFGPTQEAPAAPVADGDIFSILRREIRKLEHEAPQVAAMLVAGEAVACGLRIDDGGNAAAGLRLSLRPSASMPPFDAAADQSPKPPPTIYQSGEFVINGAGRLPAALTAPAAGTYAQMMADSLKNEIRVAVDDTIAARFQRAVEVAAEKVQAASVLTRPGNPQDGSYSNAFAAIRVESAKPFIDATSEIMSAWNEMNKNEQDEAKLVFETETVQVGSRDATQYSVDMAEAFGAAAIPEVRPSMERLFGPGGKLRLLVVPVDDFTVLVAAATPEQATPVLDALTAGGATAWDERTNRLLPQDASWRLMLSPHGHSRWMKRQMDAVLGPVIGGPLIREFPVSPPVGLAGGFTGHNAWIDAAIPAETIRAAGKYLHQR